jgi:hypothetical protein
MQGRVGADWGRWFLLYAIVRNSENVKRWCVKPRAFVVIEVGYVSRYIFTENAENHQENQCHQCHLWLPWFNHRFHRFSQKDRNEPKNQCHLCHLWLQSSRFAEMHSTFLKF